MKTVCVFDHIILNRENIFCSFRELRCRLLVLVLTTVVMILFFSWKKMAKNKLPIRPRGRFPQHAVFLLDTRPELNFQCRRFFVSEDELEFCINSLCSQFLKIQAFAKFVLDNHKRTINQHVWRFDNVFWFFAYVFN